MISLTSRYFVILLILSSPLLAQGIRQHVIGKSHGWYTELDITFQKATLDNNWIEVRVRSTKGCMTEIDDEYGHKFSWKHQEQKDRNPVLDNGNPCREVWYLPNAAAGSVLKLYPSWMGDDVTFWAVAQEVKFSGVTQ